MLKMAEFALVKQACGSHMLTAADASLKDRHCYDRRMLLYYILNEALVSS